MRFISTNQSISTIIITTVRKRMLPHQKKRQLVLTQSKRKKRPKQLLKLLKKVKIILLLRPLNKLYKRKRLLLRLNSLLRKRKLSK
jgi:hypothetical protein